MNDEKITLILGENGLGKTVMLKLIKAFYDEDFVQLKEIFFGQFSLFYDNEVEFRITRFKKENSWNIKIEKYTNGQKGPNTFTPQLNQARRSAQVGYWTSEGIHKYPLHSRSKRDIDFIVKRFIPADIVEIGPDLWMDYSSNKTYSTRRLLDTYRDFLPKEFFPDEKPPSWLREYTNERTVQIIESQRLLNRIKSEDSKYTSAVAEFSKEIIDKIKSKRAEASDLASRLDRTYPNRLLDKLRNQEQISDKQLAQNLNQIEEFRNNLTRIGLIEVESEENYIQSFNEINQEGQIKNVLLLYIDDSKEKLAIYEDLSKRMSLLINIINSRFLHKEFKIDKQKGFTYKSTINDNIIPLSGLSSGEQHELVLFYQLLFNTSPGSLVLIDEPEISLHISWQKQFINDLKEVVKLNPMDIVIATHSPDIINKYWDLTNQLDKNNIVVTAKN